MRKFFNQQMVQNLNIPREFSIFNELLPLNDNRGSLLNPTSSGEIVLKLTHLASLLLDSEFADLFTTDN